MDLDWPRAKSILIICFFVGNLILGYQLWVQHRGIPVLEEVLARDDERASVAVADKLEEAGLYLEVALPTETPRMYPLKLSRDEPDVQDLRTALFGTDNVEPVIIGGRLSGYRSGEAILVVGGSGAVRFQRTAARGGGYSSPDEALQLADSFLDDAALGPAGLRFDYSKEKKPGSFIIFYCQDHRDRPIYGGGIMVIAEGGQIREYQRLWFEVLGHTDRARTVISAATAISANVARIAAAGSPPARITGISLGYHAGMSTEEVWTADPVWRVRLHDDIMIFINAFTGAIEWPL